MYIHIHNVLLRVMNGYLKRLGIVMIHFLVLQASAQSKTDVYLIPGQGADYRLFDSLRIDSSFNVVHIKYSTPERGMDMNKYAMELAKQIDTTNNFVLIGTSLGGMLATEMTTFIQPEKVILISSAKCRDELPFRYRFQKYIPVFEVIPRCLIKSGAVFLQPLVEKDSRNNKDVFKAMLRDKDSKFLKRTIRMIIYWDRKELDSETIHIHGNSDKTIPIRNMSYHYEIENGSHMITLTRAVQVSEIINKELNLLE